MRGCDATQFERNAITKAVMTSDAYEQWTINEDTFKSLVHSLKTESIENDPSQFLPIGSVEFMRTVFDAFGVKEPDSMDYPSGICADSILSRRVKRVSLSAEHSGLFVKPVQTKKFDACVMPTIPKELIGTDAWVSPVIRFGGEWRAYVQSGEIIGIARYDDLDTNYHEHEILPFIERVIDCVALDATIKTNTYAVDVGIVNDKLVLVELNDAWATGYYAGGISPYQYLSWLQTRWIEMTSDGETK